MHELIPDNIQYLLQYALRYTKDEMYLLTHSSLMDLDGYLVECDPELYATLDGMDRQIEAGKDADVVVLCYLRIIMDIPTVYKIPVVLKH